MFSVYDLIFVLPAMLLAMYAQFKVQNTFKKYLSYSSLNGYTGAQVARYILDNNGLRDVSVEVTEGVLSDHYDPRNRVVRLSSEVYNGSSVASIGVAAHETGHAVQHSENYLPLTIRASLVPVASFGSWIAMPLILIGFLLKVTGLLWIGIIAFSAAVLFQIVTLPVEFNASRRALSALSNGGILIQDELAPTKKVLDAAAFTYVAATLTVVAQLMSFILSLFSSNNE